MNRLLPFVLALLAAAPIPNACAQPAGETDEAKKFAEARALLVRSIADYAEPIGERADPRVLDAMGTVPRHRFVPPALRAEAYADYPLPIGEDQTISQPSLVALMTHLLRPKAGDVMLEVGTGSGYQAALLSRLVRRVHSVEIVEPLARRAAERLAELGYANIEVRHGDGYAGWPDQAPFDGIIVTAGAPHVPKPLLDQLKPGGRMVIPVGSAGATQQLKLITKDARGRVRERLVIPVRFVPLTRELRD
ncbi:MAG TPA: protein-L-isoaspartate(D-aspartate) O-methyltransferase [Allosphingosinicella sp.]